jgi:hypothetical protein
MRRLLQVALSLVIAGTLGIIIHRLGAEDVAGKTGRTSARAQGNGPRAAPPRTALTYPERVAIPDDVPSVALITVPVKGTEPEEELVYIPGAYYLEAHYDGWQRCLSRVADGRFDRLDEWRPVKTMQTWVEEYELRGAKDGYTACAEAVRKLREESVPDESIRRMAAGEHLQRGVSPLARDLKRSARANAQR